MHSPRLVLGSTRRKSRHPRPAERPSASPKWCSPGNSGQRDRMRKVSINPPYRAGTLRGYTMFHRSIESGKCRRSITVAAFTAFASALLATTAASACDSGAGSFASYGSYSPRGYAPSAIRHSGQRAHHHPRHTVHASEKTRATSTPAAAADDSPSGKDDASTTAEALARASAPATPSAVPARTSTPAAAPAVAVNAVAAPPAGPVCDGFLSNGCYLAKRKVSTPNGIELRCSLMCD